jgi:hypothetical protein
MAETSIASTNPQEVIRLRLPRLKMNVLARRLEPLKAAASRDELLRIAKSGNLFSGIADWYLLVQSIIPQVMIEPKCSVQPSADTVTPWQMLFADRMFLLLWGIGYIDQDGFCLDDPTSRIINFDEGVTQVQWKM